MEQSAIISREQLIAIDLLRARSDLLDAFADLEAYVAQLLRSAVLPVNGPHFAVKLESFRKIEGIAQIAKANLPKRDKLADQAASLLPVRADIVHSHMHVHDVDGVPTGFFTNSQNLGESYPLCRVLNAKDLQMITRKVLGIVEEMKKLGEVANPASSPRRPSPGAAGGP